MHNLIQHNGSRVTGTSGTIRESSVGAVRQDTISNEHSAGNKLVFAQPIAWFQ